MKSSKARPNMNATTKTMSVPLTHNPAPGWTTSQPPDEPTADQYERFRDLTQRLLQVPKNG
jgi:hypothetical protein